MKSQRSTTLSPDRARSVAAVLSATSALMVVTCATATRTPIVASATGPAAGAVSVAPNPGVAPVPSVASSAQGEPVTAAATPPLPQGSALSRFQAALRDAPHRTEPVRILWLGDSHTAADFWPDAVRKPLQAAFGSGGPGFLYLGLGLYRHGGIKLSRDGKWHVEPRQPS